MSKRLDALGLFWQDFPIIKVVKEVIKRTPPEPIWENDDYLPHLEEARSFTYDLASNRQLVKMCVNQEPLVYDIECYSNYFLIAFAGVHSRKLALFEMSEDSPELEYDRLEWIVTNFPIIGFNSNRYDLPLVELCLKGVGTRILKEASDAIIKFNNRPNDIRRTYKTTRLKVNHIDLIELGLLRASLKLLAGRMGAPTMQDLPFNPAKQLTQDQRTITKWYCINDLNHTKLFFDSMKGPLGLRVAMSQKYNIDLRSKSDAQIAEAVLGSALRSKLGRIDTPSVKVGAIHKYEAPTYIEFKLTELKQLFNDIKDYDFIVSEFGNIPLPDGLSGRIVRINKTEYKLGIGGLHSVDKFQSFVADEDHYVSDWDVESYYPRIIVNNYWAPKHLGDAFLQTYGGIVEQRITAKRSGNKTEADVLKITINGSFGKFGSQHSLLYSPELVIQVTLTGQLSLLMLIEQLELAGIPVISANTDGVTAHYKKVDHVRATKIIEAWGARTSFIIEHVFYKAIFFKDVNNYFAIKADGIKAKGMFVEEGLSKNPSGTIIAESIKAWLVSGISIVTTIESCTDIKKFLHVRTVKGGAVFDGEYLGKVVRWYYSTEIEGEIVYAKSGNKVPKSDNSRPCMTLPTEFPTDIDYQRYIDEASKYLKMWTS
jgi:hypothetical protein